MANNLTNSPGFIASSAMGNSRPPSNNTRSRQGLSERRQSDFDVLASNPSGPPNMDVSASSPSAHSTIDAFISNRSSRSDSPSSNEGQFQSLSSPSRRSSTKLSHSKALAELELLKAKMRADKAEASLIQANLEHELEILKLRSHQPAVMRKNSTWDVDESDNLSQSSHPSPFRSVPKETSSLDNPDPRTSKRVSNSPSGTSGAYSFWEKPADQKPYSFSAEKKVSASKFAVAPTSEKSTNLVFKSSANPKLVPAVSDNDDHLTIHEAADLYQFLGEGHILKTPQAENSGPIISDGKPHFDDYYHSQFRSHPIDDLKLTGKSALEQFIPEAFLRKIVNAADNVVGNSSIGPQGEINAITKNFATNIKFSPDNWTKKEVLQLFIEYHKLQNAVQASPTLTVPKTFGLILKNNPELAQFLLKQVDVLVHKIFKHCTPKLEFQVRLLCVSHCKILVAEMDPMLLALLFHTTAEPMDFYNDILPYIEEHLVPNWPKWHSSLLTHNYFAAITEVIKTTMAMPIISLQSIGMKLFHAIDDANPNPAIISTKPMTPPGNFGNAVRNLLPYDAGVQYVVFSQLPTLIAKTSDEFLQLISEIEDLFNALADHLDTNATLYNDSTNAPLSQELKRLNNENGRIEVVSKDNPKYKNFYKMFLKQRNKLTFNVPPPPTAHTRNPIRSSNSQKWIPVTASVEKPPFLPKEEYKKLMQERRDAEFRHDSVKPSSQVSSKHAHFNGQVPNSMPRESDRGRGSFEKNREPERGRGFYEKNLNDRHYSRSPEADRRPTNVKHNPEIVMCRPLQNISCRNGTNVVSTPVLHYR